ncbi:CPCC family cysteine-rich protein [Streptomyces sp. NPDC002917]|uniref:CPCC family cysteine-rich protein n=1 Tax=Streptomyces sp. NPDC002917 TaxID=3364671 RepID=UPI00368DB492
MQLQGQVQLSGQPSRTRNLSWGSSSHDADRVRGGPNGPLSLTEARRNFHDMGSRNERSTKFVRAMPRCPTSTQRSDITS